MNTIQLRRRRALPLVDLEAHPIAAEAAVRSRDGGTVRTRVVACSLLLVGVLAGCVADAGDGPVGEPVATPAGEPVATPVDPSERPDPVEQDPAEARPPAGPVLDWDDPTGEASLGDGWMLIDCLGDAPLWCFEHGGELRGTLEFGRRPDDERLADAVDDEDRYEALHALVLDFGAWLTEDRAVGCPGHTVELAAAREVTVAGAPGVVRAHTMRDGSGTVVESSLAVHVADGADHVLFTVNANEEDACVASEAALELRPAELEVLAERIVDLIRRGPLTERV
jgi:hypothetical protein